MIARLCCLTLLVSAGVWFASSSSAQGFYPRPIATLPLAPVYSSPYVAARPVVPATYVAPYSAGFAPSYVAPPYVAGFSPAVSVYRPTIAATPIAAPIYQPAVAGVPVAGVPVVGVPVVGVPAVARTKFYVPGQPVRNFARAITP